MQQDTTGLGVIILSALTEEQWIEEDEFARKLNLPPKVVRKAMRFLEQVGPGLVCWGWGWVCMWRGLRLCVCARVCVCLC